MNPLLAPVIADLLWRSLLATIKTAERFDRRADGRRRFIGGADHPHKILRDATRIAADRMTAVEAIDPHIGGEQLRGFLSSPDAEAVVRMVYILRLEDTSLEQLEQQFLADLALWVGAAVPDFTKHGARLFAALTAGCQQVLDLAVSENVLAAHEANSNLRHKLLSNQLTAIERNIMALRSNAAPREEILRFADSYRSQVAARERYIVPPHLDRRTKVPIDSLYVPPHFAPSPADDSQAPLTYANLVDGIDRTVILGDPGAGKSTLAVKLCQDLARRNAGRVYRERPVVPILVTLRDFGARRKTDAVSIADFIAMTAKVRYQLPSVPQGAFDYLLRTGRAMVIFDGLDELLDSAYRQTISDDVETFAALFPATPILVTSRIVGYEQAELDPDIFETFSVAPFTEPQVLQYAHNWFRLDTDRSVSGSDALRDGFLRESGIVADLRTNPLMLGLMCNLYQGAEYIPANRPDVYEKCAIMLFERWDSGRGFPVAIPFQSKLRPAIAHLAHWIYQDESRRAGVTRVQLIGEAANYLYPRQFEDEDEAREAAEKFVAVCTGRAWVFTDTGLTPTGEAIFQFTHSTFLEYFCGEYLARRHQTPTALVNALLPRIVRREWDVVAQLAVQIKTRYVEDAADEILGILRAEGAKSSDAAKSNLLLFAGRSLEFLVPSPACVTSVVDDCVACALALTTHRGQAERHSEPIRGRDRRDTAVALLSSLSTAGSESWPTVLSALSAALKLAVRGSDKRNAAVACEATFYARLLTRPVSWREERDDRTRELDEMGRRVLDECREQACELAERDIGLLIDSVSHGMTSPAALVERGGCDLLFLPRRLHLFVGRTTPPVVVVALSGVMSDNPAWYWGPRRTVCDALLGEVGALLGGNAPPWVTSGAVLQHDWLSYFVQFDARRPIERAARFAMVAVLMALAEAGGGAGHEHLPDGYQTSIGYARDRLVAARVRGETDDEIEAWIADLETGQKETFQSWIRGAIRFQEAA